MPHKRVYSEKYKSLSYFKFPVSLPRGNQLPISYVSSIGVSHDCSAPNLSWSLHAYSTYTIIVSYA